MAVGLDLRIHADGKENCDSPAKLLSDNRGRVARKLRISVTDKCNFSCLFCMPPRSGVKWIPGTELLTFGEITRIARVLSTLGIKKIRITGGEPLLREGIETLVKELSGIKGIESVSMTTNGWFLSKDRAQELRKAGLQGITVSLHSLRRDRFAKISGIDGLQRVVDGIDAVREAGLSPVKINTVAIRGYNDDEIMDIVDFARGRDISLRFIEFMPLDGLNAWEPGMILSGKQILDIISRQYRLGPRKRRPGDTATIYEFEGNDGIGKNNGSGGDIGLITPVSNPFCDDCDRIRLTADGKLLTCLFDTSYYDLKPYVRGRWNEDTDSDSEWDCKGERQDAPIICNSNKGNGGRSSFHLETKSNGDAHYHKQLQRHDLQGQSNTTTAVTEENDYCYYGNKRDKSLASYITRCVQKKPPGIAYMTPLSLEKMREKRPRAMHAIGG